MNWKWLVVLILLLILIIFTAQNYEIVEIDFLLWSFKTSRAIIIFSTLVLGIVIGWVSLFMNNRR